MHYLNMALIDKASLLFVPSVVAQEKAFNILPSGNRAPDSTDQNSGYDQTRADFTFDRGSNAGATRIGSDGLIKKYRENVLLQSNQFDTTWTNVNSIETSGQSGYDGSSNAWLLTLTGGTATKLITQSTSTLSGVYNTSFYAKAGTHSIVQIGTSTQSNIFVCFDLSNGSVGSLSSNAIDAKATSIVNGWYRIEVTFLATNATGISIAGVDSISATRFQSTSSNGNFYIQNAQLESGMVSTDYLDSGATTGKAGVLIDLPRINFDANGENGSLLLEPSRANLVQYSEYFGGWTLNSNGTGSDPVLDFGYTSPEGKDNAYKVTLDSGAGTTTSDESIMYLSKSGVTTGSEHTASVYLKGAVGGEEVIVRDTEGNYKKWTLTTEWARYEYTQTAAGSSYATSFGIRQGVVGTINSSAVVYIYGFQSELGSYKSSYIPNHGTSGGVTRAADSCSVTGASDVIGQTEGTLFVEFKYNSVKDHYWAVATLMGSNTSELIELYGGPNSNVLAFAMNDNSVNQFIKQTPLSFGTHKVAIAYAENNTIAYIDGSPIGSVDTNCTIPTLTQLAIGKFSYSSSVFFSLGDGINQTLLFKERLTNEELATLTTL